LLPKTEGRNPFEKGILNKAQKFKRRRKNSRGNTLKSGHWKETSKNRYFSQSRNVESEPLKGEKKLEVIEGTPEEEIR